MGKVDMRDPYGHDKESGREGRERGRVIREGNGEDPPADEEPLLLDATIDFSAFSMDDTIALFEANLLSYQTSEVLQDYYTWEEWYDIMYNHFFPGGDYTTATGIRMNTCDPSIAYDLSINYDISMGDIDSGTYIITTTLTAAQDYDRVLYVYDPVTGTSVAQDITYTNGEVIFQDSQEVSLDAENSTYSVDTVLPNDIMGSTQNEAFYVTLEATITDTLTGATYTQTYDSTLYLYRCPYGRVTDKLTGSSIANAKVTVHFEDGSIVPLDKASNPTATNPQITDATGRYGFKLETNRKYYLTASADGYEDYKSETFTEKWHVLREDISLSPAPYASNE